MIYHQNIQLSMKQEALAHLNSSLFHCKERWNNSRSMRCNTLEMQQPPKGILFTRWCPLRKYSWALFRTKSKEIEGFYFCVYKRERDASTEGDRGLTAEIKMESILVLEAHSSAVWGPARRVSPPLLFQSLPILPPLLYFNCSAFPSLQCLCNFSLSFIVTPFLPLLSSSSL